MSNLHCTFLYRKFHLYQCVVVYIFLFLWVQTGCHNVSANTGDTGMLSSCLSDTAVDTGLLSPCLSHNAGDTGLCYQVCLTMLLTLVYVAMFVSQCC